MCSLWQKLKVRHLYSRWWLSRKTWLTIGTICNSLVHITSVKKLCIATLHCRLSWPHRQQSLSLSVLFPLHMSCQRQQGRHPFSDPMHSTCCLHLHCALQPCTFALALTHTWCRQINPILILHILNTDNVHAACITESHAGDYMYIYMCIYFWVYGLGLVHKQHLISQTSKWCDDCQTHYMHVMQINQLHASCQSQLKGSVDSS